MSRPAAWPGLTVEQIDVIADGLRGSVERLRTLRMAGAISAGEQREMLNELELLIADSLIATGCPCREIEKWILCVASAAGLSSLVDIKPAGNA